MNWWTSYCACQGVPTRVHSECFTGDVLASKRGGPTERGPGKHRGMDGCSVFCFWNGKVFQTEEENVDSNYCEIFWALDLYNVYFCRRGPPLEWNNQLICWSNLIIVQVSKCRMFVLFHNGSDGLERVFVTFHQDSSVRGENVLENKVSNQDSGGPEVVDWWLLRSCEEAGPHFTTNQSHSGCGAKAFLRPALEGQLASLFHAHILHIIHSGPQHTPMVPASTCSAHGPSLWNSQALCSKNQCRTFANCITHFVALQSKETRTTTTSSYVQSTSCSTNPQSWRLLRCWEIKLGHCTKTFATGWGHSIDPQAQRPDSGIAARSWCHLQGTDGWCGHEARSWKKGTPGQAQAVERSSKADVAKQNFCAVPLIFWPAWTCAQTWAEFKIFKN